MSILAWPIRIYPSNRSASRMGSSRGDLGKAIRSSNSLRRLSSRTFYWRCYSLPRLRWRKHHVAFLITHLGIITLLTGSLIGRIWGVEGTITLFEGEPPTNRLLIDQHQTRVDDVDGIV